MKYKLSAAMIGIYAAFSIIAYAITPNIEQDVDNGVVRLNGAISAIIGETVALQILRPDVKISNIPGGEGMLEGYSLYVGSQKAGSDGLFSFTVSMPEEKGIYTILISSESQPAESKKVMLAPPEYINSAVALFNQPSADIPALITEYMDLFGFDFDPYNELVSEKKSLTEVYAALTGKNFTTPLALQQAFRKSVFSAYIKQADNSGEIGALISQYSYELFDMNADAYSYYNDADFTALKGREASQQLAYANKSSYKEGFLDDCVALAAVNVSQTFSMADVVFKLFARQFDIDIDAYNSLGSKRELVYKDVIKNDYSTISAFCTAFSDSVKNHQSQKSDSTGGGGKSTGGSNYEFLPKTEQSANTPLTYFKDLDNIQWAAKEVEYLYKKGIVNGRSEGIFDGTGLVTREEFIKMLVESLKLQKGGYTAEFSDMMQDAWYAPYISASVEHNIARGMGDGRFGIGEYITREDMAVMAAGALAAADNPITAGSAIFTDNNDISDYAKESISGLYAKGVINGVGDNRFDPKGNATRGTAAKIVYGLMNITGGVNADE